MAGKRNLAKTKTKRSSAQKRIGTLASHFLRMANDAKRRKIAPADSTINNELTRSWRAVLGPPPMMGTTNEEKQNWLSFMKRKWALQKRQQMLRRLNVNPRMTASTVVASGDDADVSFLQDTGLYSEQIWRIIQILETSQLGLFRIWILENRELRQIMLRVPRIFYINQRTPKEIPNSEVYRQVDRILPRANEVYHLYEYRVDEEHFQKQLNQLQLELSAPYVEGVYESQVPLLFRVFANVGCACRVLDDSKQIGDTFDLSQLQFISLTQTNYLEDSRLNHVYMYHYTQDSRCMLALFFPTVRKAHVYVVDKNRTNAMPNLDTLYISERNDRLCKMNEDELPANHFQFETVINSNINQAYKSAEKLLKTYKNAIRTSTIIVFESALDTQQLLSVMPAFGELPLVKLRVVANERLYSTLDWQRVGTKHMLNSFLNSKAILKASMELCQYFHIPLGNIPEDPTLFGADLFFARQLWKNNYVLWCSPTERPDFGGKEVDDNRLITDASELKDLDFNKPKLYDSACFDLELASIPATALLQAHRISEYVPDRNCFNSFRQLTIDEIVGGQSAYRILSAYDESALCVGVFNILKTVVHGWIKDITIHRNVFADNQIIHLYRWICNPNSLLYDPALKSTLHRHMKKLLLLVVAELESLGATIVFASLSRLVICTNKSSNPDATEDVNNLLKQLQQKDLFSALDITITQQWKMLVWLDSANYGAVTVESKQLSGEEVGVDDDNVPTVDMNWNMMHFLPEAYGCQANFKMLVVGYIIMAYQEMRKLELTGDWPMSPQKREEPETSHVSFKDESANKSTLLQNEDPFVAFRRQLITGELSEKFYSIIDKMQRKVSLGSRDGSVTNVFPSLPGRHLKCTNPALELVKSVCKVLSLDRAVDEEIVDLRRDLLKLIGISEYAEEARWTDPCLSYRLNEVVCRNCNYCRDLDLCRDPYMARDTPDGSEMQIWRCSQCKTPYDIKEIEMTLINDVNSLSMSYCLQDLACSKCKQIKQAHMNMRCECGGQYNCTISSETIVALKLKTLSNIASYYSMKNLQETLHWILILNPRIQNLLT